jgi:transglutaminase-like putative cysteine protease
MVIMRDLLLEESHLHHPSNFIDRLNAVFIMLTVLLAIATTVMAVSSPNWGEQVGVISLGQATEPSDTPLFMVESTPDARYLRGAVGIDYNGMEWELEEIEGDWAGINISSDRDNLPLYPTELAQSPSDYEREILNAASFVNDPRYLELPDDIPGRVADISRDITERFDTPFEKARAIEVFLKINYTYDLDFTPAPEDWEPNDWFLFESEEGICGNFASAFVVLARSSGIPARLAAGYYVRAGEGDQFVYGNQAHAWAEVGFEELGWIAFDAT